MTGVQQRVLVVDDDAAIRLLLHTRLQLEPDFIVVAQAMNGRDALDAATRLHPSVVVLDLVMPVLDGADAIPLLREAVPDVRIVVYSANAKTAHFAAGGEPDAVILKGTPLTQVVARLRELAA